MKRKLALLMAFMMAATLVPAQPSDAASKNSVDRVVSLESNSSTTGTASEPTTPPMLIVKEENVALKGDFKLQLNDGAEWGNMDFTMTVEGKTVNVVRQTDTIVTVETKGAELKELRIPLRVKFDGAPEGAQKVKVLPIDSTLTAGEYTFATIGASKIAFKVEKKEKISRSGDKSIQLIFDETTRNGFGEKQYVELRLPTGFSWDEKKIETSALVDKAKTTDEDKRILRIDFLKGKSDKLDSAYVKLPIQPSRNARYGDVDVTVNGNRNISPSSLVVAEYVDYTVEVKAEKVLDVLAGRDINNLYVSNLTITEPAVSSLQGKRYMEFKFVDENGKEVNASLQDTGKLQLTRKAGNATLVIDSSAIDHYGVKSKVVAVDIQTTKADKDNKKANKFELYVEEQSKDNSPAKYELEVPFVVASNFTGKLYLEVKGAGVEEQKVEIANVKPIATVEIKGKLPQVKIGLQKQKAADIVIKETEAGTIQDFQEKGTEKVVASNYGTYSIRPAEDFDIDFQDAKLEVDGTIGVRNLEKQDWIVTPKPGESKSNYLQVQIDRRSTKPSTLTFKDLTLTLDRTVPYGDVKFKANFGLVGSRHDLSNTVKTFDYLTTVTPVSDDKRVTTVFTIGEKMFTEVIGGVKEEKTADVAPFIKDNRTMLPVRYVADAIGAIVNYDPTTRVATFQKNQTVVSINIDKDVMYANGSPIKLDTKPANVEGRIFLPIANIAQAFGLKHGVNIIWNQENKTVTILPQDAKADEIEAAKEGKVVDNATTKEETKTEEKK